MNKEDIKALVSNLLDMSNTSKQYENACIKLFSQLYSEYGVTADEFITVKNEVC